MAEIKFPKDFLWGASTSSHQIEGNNQNDWSVWEKQNAKRLAREAGPKKNYSVGALGPELWQINALEAKQVSNYISGKAADNFNLWEDDLRLIKELNLNTFRFTIEWSRIEPSKGNFDQKALDHYARLIDECSKQGITPFISLSHWTLPLWAAEAGGWQNTEVIAEFTKYCNFVARQLAHVKPAYWLIINEPEVNAGQAYLLGEWPPQKKNPIAWRKVLKNLADAHIGGYRAIKAINPSAQVSSALNMTHFDPARTILYPLNKAMTVAADYLMNRSFVNKVKDHLDYIGLNHYMHCVINGGVFKNKNEPRSDLGWFLYPPSLYHALKIASRYKCPIFITEHGLADKRDKYRSWYLKESLAAVKRAIDEGVDVRGYMHWSLLDNFEWDKGFWPKFGLVEVDRKTMKRTIRPSAKVYAQIAKDNGFSTNEK